MFIISFFFTIIIVVDGQNTSLDLPLVHFSNGVRLQYDERGVSWAEILIMYVTCTAHLCGECFVSYKFPSNGYVVHQTFVFFKICTSTTGS